MADNYLENRMEEYRSGRLAVRSRTSSAMRMPHRSDTLTLHYAPMPVVIIADDINPVVAETVGAFTSVGCRVAFTAGDAKEGNAMAQHTGARYYPSSFTTERILSDFTAHCNAHLEVIVSFLPASLTSPAIDTHVTRLIDASSLFATLSCSSQSQPPSSVAPSILARHILYLAHPDNAFLIGGK